MSFSLAAQISTSHSSQNDLSVEAIRHAIDQTQAIIPLSILITGGREVPEIFQELTNPSTRPVQEVYLWYNLLSDYPGQSSEDLVINYRGETSHGWGGWQAAETSVEETFSFGCPNNPVTRQKTLEGLSRMLQAYPFDGVFLDKFRFPSPANGLEMVLSCFCPHCFEAAQKQGLDLHPVKELFEEWKPVEHTSHTDNGSQFHSHWIEALTKKNDLLKRFIRFRSESVVSLVGEVRKITMRLGRKVGLDLFSPGLAPIVGQDYASLVNLTDWAKPMTYRRAYGPAGLRLEIEGLVKGFQRIYGISEDALFKRLEQACPAYSLGGYHEMISSNCVPMEWMNMELRLARSTFPKKPLLMGLETVKFPGVIEITPENVIEMLQAGLKEGVQGAVISWDLLNTPVENIQAIKDCLK